MKLDTLALLAATNNARDEFSIAKTNINAHLGVDNDNYILKEILGARADNKNHKFQYKTEISALGTVTLSSEAYKSNIIHQGQALNTLDVFLIGAGLKSNLITGGLTTKQGLNNKISELKGKTES